MGRTAGSRLGNLRVRRATAKDIEPLLVLESRFPSDRISQRAFRHLLVRGRAEIWVAIARAAMVGDAVLLFRANSKRARLYSIVVDSSVRGRGIGARLLRKIEDRALARSCSHIGLEVRASAARVINWYRRRGYVPVRRVSGYYEDGNEALRMEKRLRV
jgi:ribosomal protein S18 acetylase RimI-like enzyme